MSLDSIRSLVQEDMANTDKFIFAELESHIPLINQLVQYILNCGGKRIRPLLVLLSARACEHNARQHIDLAAAIELIHTATLLHDDVVDASTLRRGHETAHTIWGSEASVLVGDFLYSRAFQTIVKLENLPVMKIFADATNLIAEGEILQLANCNDPHVSEANYYEVIQRKTGKLFEVSSQLGPAISASTAVVADAMQSYGMNLGIAYQLIDDALDYNASAEQTGKNIGTDLAEGKPTLPLIHALRSGSAAEVKIIQNAIKTGSCKELDAILGIIESTKAIEYTATAAKNHAHKANLALAHLPDSPYKKALSDLADFVVERSY